MKRSKFSDRQILSILKQAENGVSVAEFCSQYNRNLSDFYKWWAKYGGMDASLMARLRDLEYENGRLKRIYADAHIRAEVVTEALAKT